MLLTGAGNALAQNFEGKKVVSVGVRYVGARTVDEARIRGNMTTRAGTTYSASRLDDDVRSLYSSGLVDDCLLYTSPSPRDLSTSRMPSSA